GADERGDDGMALGDVDRDLPVGGGRRDCTGARGRRGAGCRGAAVPLDLDDVVAGDDTESAQGPGEATGEGVGLARDRLQQVFFRFVCHDTSSGGERTGWLSPPN